MIVPSRRNLTLAPPAHVPVLDDAASHGTDARDAEDLAHLRLAHHNFLELGLEQADHGVLHVFDKVVNDLVQPDFDVLGLGCLARVAVRAHVEADDRGLGGRGELHIVLVDPADATADEGELHVTALELAQAVGHCLERTVHIGLEHEVERGCLARLHLPEDVLQPRSAAAPASSAGQAGLALPMLAGLGHLACGLLVGGDDEQVTCTCNLAETEHLHWCGRTRLAERSTAIVGHGTHAAPGRAGNHRFADTQGAPLHQHRCDRTPAAVEMGLQHDSDSPAR